MGQGELAEAVTIAVASTKFIHALVDEVGDAGELGLLDDCWQIAALRSGLADLRKREGRELTQNEARELAEALVAWKREGEHFAAQRLRERLGATPLAEGALGGVGRLVDASYVATRVQFYDVMAGLNWGCSIGALYRDAAAGDERSLLRLVQVDKCAIYDAAIEARIRRKQKAGDWKFFGRLGRAIARSPLNREPYLLHAVLVVACIWDEWKGRASYREMLKELKREGVLPDHVTRESFRKKLNSVGLKKSRPRRRQEKTG